METDLIINLITHIEKQLKLYNVEFDGFVFERQHTSFGKDEEEKEHDYFESTYEQLESTASVINRSFITLFDITNSIQTLIDYKTVINNRYQNREELVSGKYIEVADMYISNLYSDWWDFFEPYRSLVCNSVNKVSNEHSISILEKLLEETNTLCKLSNAQPKSEPQVYNAVKKYINLLFPKSKNVAGQSFPTIIKVYKPDIYIPECNSVVEYKYIDSEAKISTTIEGIVDDVKGYQANYEYKYFYAVFYFTESFVTKERFSEIWKEKKFPKDWKYFYCIETK